MALYPRHAQVSIARIPKSAPLDAVLEPHWLGYSARSPDNSEAPGQGGDQESSIPDRPIFEEPC